MWWTHDFSVTEYYDENGKLKAIHRSGGQFLGEEDDDIDYDVYNNDDEIFTFLNKSNTPKIDSIKSAYNFCKKANFSDKKKDEICYKKISSLINTHVRNQRTMVLDAKLFFDLISNKSKKTLIVTQNQKMTLINGTYIPLENNNTNVNNVNINSAI